MLKTLRAVMRFRRRPRGRAERLRARAVNIADLRLLARRRLPRGVFGYIDGGAEDEMTLRANTLAYRRRRFAPRVLRDMSVVDTTTTLLGQTLSIPLVLAPHRVHPYRRSAGRACRGPRSRPRRPALQPVHGEHPFHRGGRGGRHRAALVSALHAARPRPEVDASRHSRSSSFRRTSNPGYGRVRFLDVFPPAAIEFSSLVQTQREFGFAFVGREAVPQRHCELGSLARGKFQELRKRRRRHTKSSHRSRSSATLTGPRRPRAVVYRSRQMDYVEPDPRHAGLHHVQVVGGAVRQVDDATLDVRAAVVDAHDGGCAGVQAGSPAPASRTAACGARRCARACRRPLRWRSCCRGTPARTRKRRPTAPPAPSRSHSRQPPGTSRPPQAVSRGTSCSSVSARSDLRPSEADTIAV